MTPLLWLGVIAGVGLAFVAAVWLTCRFLARTDPGRRQEAGGEPDLERLRRLSG